MNTKVSNCITEIPQDIKLELNNGTLTLKAGSKVYVPNEFKADGITPKFDVVVISSDITINSVGADDQCSVYYNKSENNLVFYYKTAESSGTTPPTWDGTFYNISNNTIKRYASGSAINQLSLPLATITDGTSAISSIDQVFNGFGYIGSTVFALPGVKGRIPNGRNADGSLKNIEYTVPNVILFTQNTANVNSVLIGNTKEFGSYLNQSEFLGNFSSDNIPAPSGNWGSYYNSTENQFYIFYNNVWNKTNRLKCADITWADGKITSLTPKTVFHALDYNDKSTISGWSMPSGRYINLTLGASGSTYTAPANGWINFVHQGSNGQWIYI